MVFAPMEQEKMPGEIVVEEIIRNYPNLLSLHRERQSTSVTASYEEHIASSGRKDPTAHAALHELSEGRQRSYEAVRKAIRETHRHTDGLARLKVIDLIYWKRTHSLSEAAKEAQCSVYTAEVYQRDFIQIVQRHMDIVDCDGCQHYRRLYNDRACFYCLDEGRLRSRESCLSAEVKRGYTPPTLLKCPYYKEVG